MKHTFILLISALLFCCPVDAQERVIDSTDRSPISAASIFDATGIGLSRHAPLYGVRTAHHLTTGKQDLGNDSDSL